MRSGKNAHINSTSGTRGPMIKVSLCWNYFGLLTSVIHRIVFDDTPILCVQKQTGVTITRYPYEGSKSSERPVRLDRTEGHIIIDGRAYPARELVEALAQSGYNELTAVGDSLMLGRRRITPIFKSRQDRAMASLCHGSLAFCCPVSKRCAERDRALEMLGLTPDEYGRLKDDAHMRFIDSAKGLSNAEESRTHDERRRRLANEPASDRGYGSDDYRRDFDTLERSIHLHDKSQERTSDPWMQSHDSPQVMDRSSRYTDRDQTDSYADLSNLFGDEHSSQGGLTSAPTCGIRSGENVEGLGALFAQGELSPFSTDSDERESRTFCFSCGRTFRAGTKVCPWCGVPQ
ncbi:MAG: hypothetical protein ACXADO_11970 [Candidatus Thorarchaeota archaeon]